MQPLGAPGRRKLQDLFVDRKIPRGQRHRVPVVEDAAGRILWVAGVAVAEAGRVSAPEGSVVILEMREDQ
jgi:tRNA(Ile)-lysidine synthase